MKTRLYKADRQAICKTIIEHKFSPMEAALLAEENALAAEAREIAYGKFLEMIERLPNGAFQTRMAVTVTVDGERHQLYFGARSWGDGAVQHRVFDVHEYSPILRLLGDSPFGSRVKDWARRVMSAKTERDLLNRRTYATLEKFTTFDALIEAWPEANKFIVECWRERPTYVANLPTVVLSELSTALDLPPDADEAVEVAA